MSNSEHKSGKKRNRGQNKKIDFSEEIVTKEAAKNLLTEEPIDVNTFANKLVSEKSVNGEAKTKSKKRKLKISTSNNENTSNDVNVKRKKKKRDQETKVQATEQDEVEAVVNGKTETKTKKRKLNISGSNENASNEVNIKPKKKEQVQEMETEATNQEVEASDQSSTKEPNNALSKRALKRMKYQNLLDSKKKISDKSVQTNALNYLSNWKYNKSEWKFEKLKQVWLTQNLYDSSKIEDQYWETLVQYFTNSQGKVRQEILDKAVKIIEDEEIELNDPVKFKRARDIVQSL